MIVEKDRERQETVRGETERVRGEIEGVEIERRKIE